MVFVEAVAAFDLAALCAVVDAARGLAGERLKALDWAAKLPIEINALKMGVPALLAMWAWTFSSGGYRADPLRALRGAAGVVLALALARAAQNLLPARPRPRVAMPDFPFPPLGDLGHLADWSSMPSDTAALAFALVAVTWASSRGVGAVAAAWAVAVTCLPRLYMGYHYLSDLLVGASLGVASVALALRAPLPAAVAASADARLRTLDARAPALLPLAFFVLGAECFYVFDSTRRLASAAGQFVEAAASASAGGAPRGAAAAAGQPTDGDTDTGGGAACAELHSACPLLDRPSALATAD